MNSIILSEIDNLDWVLRLNDEGEEYQTIVIDKRWKNEGGVFVL